MTGYLHNKISCKQIWADEFEVDGTPDTPKWPIILAIMAGEIMSFQYYTDELKNCPVENGILISKLHADITQT